VGSDRKCGQLQSRGPTVRAIHGGRHVGGTHVGAQAGQEQAALFMGELESAEVDVGQLAARS